MDETIEQKAR